MLTASKPVYLFRAALVVFLSGTLSAWLKMLVPRLSIGYWPIWVNESLRNKVGILVSMPVLELFYLGYLYILSVILYGIISHRWKPAKTSPITASFTGMTVSIAIYLMYKLKFYLESAHSYSIHKGPYPSKPWYTWVNYPEDIELLFIYAISGLLGGWLYYRLINRQRLFPTSV